MIWFKTDKVKELNELCNIAKMNQLVCSSVTE